MSQTLQSVPTLVHDALIDAIRMLAREASIEINVQDVVHLDASRALLAPGKKVFISHLPKQSWEDTERVSYEVQRAGFNPVPHIPVRLLEDRGTLERMLDNLTDRAKVQEVLLISGDYPSAKGPYSSVSDVLRSNVLKQHGLKCVSLAGHPEGHPKVAFEDIRRAEIEKAALAAQAGLDANLVTQFFFEAEPFVQWAKECRARGINARLIAGLAGPASLATLFKFAVRCGAGPSIRALGARPSSFLKLMGDHGPENVLRGLAEARVTHTADVDGIHMFCFGGYLRTCEWLRKVSEGGFTLDSKDSFKLA